MDFQRQPDDTYTMTYTLDCNTPFELLQSKADVAERGYRYVAIGLTLRYWN